MQVYATLPDADRPDRLVGFARVEVAAGATAPFAIEVPLDRLRTRDVDAGGWRPAAGVHHIRVARHAADHAIPARAIELR